MDPPGRGCLVGRERFAEFVISNRGIEMSTIHDAIRSAERYAADVQRMIDASGVHDIAQTAARHVAEVHRMLDVSGFQSLIRSVERHAEFVQSALDTVVAAQAGIERTRNFAEICIQLKWPPPWHMPARVIDRITIAYRAGKLTPEETAEIFTSFYTPERIKEFGQRWAAYGWLAHRFQILQEALENHINGRHYSAVCVLLPQIDGALREALGTKPTRANSTCIIRGYQLATAAGKFFADVVLENFDPDSAAPIPELSRHAILHGKATDYGTPTHSLKVILIADIILSSIEENRNQPAEDEPAGAADGTAPH